MRRLFLGSILLASSILIPAAATAEVNISIGFPLPPLIAFPAPPDVVVVPDTIGVYVVPEVDADLFFWNGWWWRPWEGRWYRSRYYDRGWGYFSGIPRFYFDVDPEWRVYYRDHHWHGHRWEYERIPHRRLQGNWRAWNRTRHWERERRWGVRDYQPPPPSQMQDRRRQRQAVYEQRPDVRHYQQERRDRMGPARVQPRRDPREQVQTQPRRDQREQVQTQPPRQQRQPQVRQPERESRKPYPQGRPQVDSPRGPEQPRQQMGQPRGPEQPRRQMDQPRGQQQHREMRREQPEGGAGRDESERRR